MCLRKKYKDVRTKLNEAKANLGISHSHKSSQLFSVWSDLWLEHKNISVKQSTYVRYKNSLDLHIKPKLGCFKIQLINTERLQQFLMRQLIQVEWIILEDYHQKHYLKCL